VKRVGPATGTITTGTVSFFDNGTLLSTVAISNGKASFATSGLAVGAHPVTASNCGSANDLAGTTAVALTGTIT